MVLCCFYCNLVFKGSPQNTKSDGGKNIICQEAMSSTTSGFNREIELKQLEETFTC